MRTIIIKRSIIKRSRPSQHTIRTRPRHVDSGTIKPRRVVPSVALILQFVVVRLIQDSIPSSSYRSPKTARRIASVPFASLSLLLSLSLCRLICSLYTVSWWFSTIPGTQSRPVVGTLPCCAVALSKSRIISNSHDRVLLFRSPLRSILPYVLLPFLANGGREIRLLEKEGKISYDSTAGHIEQRARNIRIDWFLRRARENRLESKERKRKECGKFAERGEFTCLEVVHIDLVSELTRVPRSLPSDYRNAPLDLEEKERRDAARIACYSSFDSLELINLLARCLLGYGYAECVSMFRRTEHLKHPNVQCTHPWKSTSIRRIEFIRKLIYPNTRPP